MRRANNQDSYAVLVADSQERFSRRGHLFVVADGMGAHAAGELASKMATDMITQYYFRTSTLGCPLALRQAVHDANADIHRRGQENPEFYNMGTTASSLAITSEGAYIAHVGDSRVYRVRGGKLEQLTFDHSLVWEMQASGQVHPESHMGKAIPKNVITRSLGPSEEVMVDLEGPFDIRPGDCFLLCSDGLSGQIPDTDLGPIMESLPVDLAAKLLIDLANLSGGPDNITLILVRVNEVPEFTPVKTPLTTPRDAKALLILATPVCVVIAAVVLGLLGIYGPMVVAAILGVLAFGVAALQLRRLYAEPDSPVLPTRTSRSAPYRHYSAKPTDDLVKRLDQVLSDLRRASQERKWNIEWTEIDRTITRAQAARRERDYKSAVHDLSDAVVATMAQLRSQHRRDVTSANASNHVLD